ncbi:acyl-CoA thioesterase [bacterium]|nr:acyl-CoA thioesterase [bacterium]
MESLSQIPVRYAETDRMGVIHHSHYPVYFEQGRTDFFIEHLRPYAEFEAQGVQAPVLSYQVEILGRATYGDLLKVSTRADWMKGVRLQMSYRIRVEEREVAAGSSLHALVDSTMKPVNPRKFPELYQELLKVFPRP